MRFFRGIAFQIWWPYATVFMLLLFSVAIYYPARQFDLLVGQKKKELTEMARSISVGIELSLDAGNFSGLEKTLKFFAGNEAEVYVMVMSAGGPEGKEEVIAFYPGEMNAAKILADSAAYLNVGQPFRSANFDGTVRIFIPRDVLQGLLWTLNYPVYILLAVAFVVTALLFYFVALRVSKPITEITGYASSLIGVDQFQPVAGVTDNEIVVLQNALFSLKQSLDYQNERNNRLTEGLEAEVMARTVELTQAVEKLNQAQNSARIGNFDYDRDTRTFRISPIIPAILGLDSTDRITLSAFLGSISPIAHGIVRPVLENYAADGRKISLDLKLRDGQKWVEFTATCRRDGSAEGVLVTGTMQDITNRKLAEAEVQKLSLVAKLSTNGILITDKKKKIVWANQSTEKLTGYSIAEMRGKSPAMFQFEGTDQATTKYIRTELDNFRKVRTEILNRSRSGRIYWVELHIEPFFDDYGHIDGYLAVEVDITDRKRYEEDLQKALVQEKELSNMKSRFITMTSHEFRTPLTTIQTNLELLGFHLKAKADGIDDKIERYFGRIGKEVDRLTGLMNDILLLGRINSGKLAFNPVSLGLVELLDEVTRNHQFVNGESRIVQIEISGEPKPVVADQVVLNQIFFNVFSNALKYSPGAPPPVCTLNFLENQVRIEVRDFGLGIPADDLPHIFESFHRGRNVSTIQGTGLGLQITRQFVEMHGGTISLQSEEGKGTTVYLTLPFQAPSTGA